MEKAINTHCDDTSWDNRTRLLLGDEAVNKLNASSVLVAGVGGVGGYAAEMLVRSGIGHITIIDSDKVSTSNINRQLIADFNSIGEDKTALFENRFRAINPGIDVVAIKSYISPGTIEELLPQGKYDFVIDAIDTVAPKCALIMHCLRNKTRIISSMGAGGRIDPGKIMYSDIWDTREDGLARAVRQKLKKECIRKKLTVVYSTEPPQKSALIGLELENKRSSFGTLATIPAIFGIYLANHVIRKLAEK